MNLNAQAMWGMELEGASVEPDFLSSGYLAAVKVFKKKIQDLEDGTQKTERHTTFSMPRPAPSFHSKKDSA